MTYLKKPNNFNGVDMIISAQELGCIIDAINATTERAVETANKELADKTYSLVKVFTEFAYYDKKEREVHCRLGYYELQMVIECLIGGSSKKGNESYFDEIIKDPATKQWISREDNGDDVNA